jgi:hypothetical protein
MFRLFGKKSDELIRLETLSEVGRRLIAESVRIRDENPPLLRSPVVDARAAAFWDAACYVVEQLGDENWRGRGSGGRNEFIVGSTGNSTGPHLHVGPVSS